MPALHTRPMRGSKVKHGIHHAGFYYNEGLYNSGSSTGPTFMTPRDMKKYYFNDDQDGNKIIPVPDVCRRQ
jgi:hypothetical protein